MRTLTCKHKKLIWWENWLYLRPYLKAFPVFNVLETCRVFLLTIDLLLNLLKKDLSSGFYGEFEICRHGPNYVKKLY